MPAGIVLTLSNGVIYSFHKADTASRYACLCVDVLSIRTDLITRPFSATTYRQNLESYVAM
jgi:hypothetical protein